MTAAEPNIHMLDAAYKPFPPFAEWLDKTSLDSVRWDRYNAALKSAPGMTPEKLKWAANIATRAAALDTGAIENLYEVDRGFTYTVAFETSAWEVDLAKRGENVRPLFEAQLHAYDYVLDLATNAEPITEAAIRVLHEVVCAAQSTYRVMTAVGPQEQPLPKGRYKSLPNHVRTRDGIDHSYAPVDVTPAEMARLVGEIRSEAFLAAHPVLQAAYAHYALVVIHPFSDGNGRVARALASAFTYRAISMPIVILSEHKYAYLNALEAADHGDFQAFIDFMLARALDTVRLVDQSMLTANAPSAEESISAISSLYITRGGYTQDQIDIGATQFLQSVERALKKAITEIAAPKIQGSVTIVAGNHIPPSPDFRPPLSNLRGLTIALNSLPPAQAQTSRQYSIHVPKNASGEDDIQLIGRADGIGTFIARTDEVIPALSGVLQILISMFAERTISEMLVDLRRLAEGARG